MEKSPLAAVIGALNIDLIIKGLPAFAAPGAQVNGRSVELTPGGKGRNIASMLAAWMAPGQVSMVGKLVVDQHGLYRIPLQSLTDSGINSDFIILEDDRPGDLPTLAIFLNTSDQQRASYYLPGRNETLSLNELDQAKPLFQHLADHDGFLLLTLEMPLETACHALSLAADIGLRVMLDPGGQPPEESVDFSPLFDHPMYLLKPNEEEAARLTGIDVSDFSSARQAAKILRDCGVEHILITHGPHGAYAFSDNCELHIPTPDFPTPPQAESTGCGDQVLAVLCAELLHGRDFENASRKAILAGSLQYRQSGLMPVLPNNPQLQ